MSKRKFKPKKKIPKQKLEQYLRDGYTLREIGKEFGVGISYISEYMKMLGIDKDDYAERQENKKKHKKERKKESFIVEFWHLIRSEIGK